MTKEPTFKNKFHRQPLESLMSCAESDLLLQGFVGFNELKNTYQFTRDFEDIKKDEFFRDEHIAVLKWFFVKHYSVQPSDPMLMQFIQLQSRKNIINPIKDWLNSLEWDGIARLDSWLHLYTSAPLNQYTAQVGRILLCGAVKRIFEPGCKFDYMVILEGEQGTMKSTLFEVLGGDYYISLSFGHQEKEIVENIQGAWFIEIADMNGFKKQEVEWLRAFLTRKSDRCRLPYARTSGDFKRQNIFVATSNPSGDNEYLKDDTGNRRFLPIATGKLNIVGLKEVRDMLFAEAVARQNEQLYLDKAADVIANEERVKREETDIWTSPIRTWLQGKNGVNTGQILNEGLHIDLTRASLYDKIRVGKIMKKLGWIRKQNIYGEWEYFKTETIIETKTTAEEIKWEE